MNAGRVVKCVICLVAALGIPAFADVVIDFSGDSGGSVAYNSATGQFDSVTGTLIEHVNGVGTPQNAGQHAVTQGTLNIHATGGTFDAVNKVYSFTGGTFSILGGVPDASIPTGTTLLNGTIGTMQIFVQGLFATIVAAGGTDTKDARLVSYFCGGCTNTGWLFGPATTTLSSPTAGFLTGGSFTAGTFSTDVANHYVPEPASLLLLGTVLVGASQILRRRVSKS